MKNHPVMVPVVTLSILVFIAGIIYLRAGEDIVAPSDSHIVLVSHDKVQETIPTRATNVKEFLEEVDIQLEKGDVVEPSLDAPIVEDNFRVNVYRARAVTIIDKGRQTSTYTAAATPRTAAAYAGVKVYAEDLINRQPVENVLREGIDEKIVIKRATPVHVNLYGTQVTIRTHDKTVGDVLSEKNIQLAAQDSVQPSLDTPLKPNMQVFVARKGTKFTTVKESVAAPVETVEDASLSFGATAVRQEGSPGTRVVTYQLTLRNGKEIARKKVQEVVTEEPVKRIIARGKAVYIPKDKSSLMAAAGIAKSDYPYVNFIISHESGWCPTKLQGQIGFCPAYAPDVVPDGLGYGLGQATPGSKMSPFGADWKSNPVTQLKWATSYATSRHGSWAGAYDFWQANTWW